MIPVNRVGSRFGHLVLLEKIEKPHSYICKCDCGNIKTILYSNIQAGNTVSCGCFRKESSRKREHKKNHPTHGRVLSYYKRNAKSRQIEWGLTSEQFQDLITKNCAYCESPPEKHAGPKKLIFNGIDRVDNNCGYVYENCVPCCATCNRAKLAMSLNSFKSWIFKVNKVLNG